MQDLGEEHPEGRNIRCKGPEARTNLMCLRTSKRARLLEQTGQGKNGRRHGWRGCYDGIEYGFYYKHEGMPLE